MTAQEKALQTFRKAGLYRFAEWKDVMTSDPNELDFSLLLSSHFLKTGETVSGSNGFCNET